MNEKEKISEIKMLVSSLHEDIKDVKNLEEIFTKIKNFNKDVNSLM